MAFLVTYIPGVFAANAVYARRGLRAGLMLAAVLNAAGALLRWLKPALDVEVILTPPCMSHS
jgi:fucose permease